MTTEDCEYIERCVNVRAYCLARMLHTPALIDDYRQEIRIIIHQRLEKFDSSRSGFHTYCDRVAHWAVRILFRRYRNERIFILEKTDNGDTTMNMQLKIDISDAFSDLPKKLRCIVIGLQERKSYRALCKEMNISYWTFKRDYIIPLRRYCISRGLNGYIYEKRSKNN